jgi:6-phosphogluconolactonase
LNPVAEFLHHHPDSLADYVAVALRDHVAEHGTAALAVSGGTTPVKFFEKLSRTPLPWEKITVTLVDDRWVGEDSPRSNARLVKDHLLQNHAAGAKFLALVTSAATPEEALDEIETALQALPLPFAAVVLGLGTDGHTASFFPGGDHLAEALEGKRLVTAMHAEEAGEPRITLTLPVLLNAKFLAIHFEGEVKKHVFNTALRDGPVEELPIRAILRGRPDAKVFWT